MKDFFGNMKGNIGKAKDEVSKYSRLAAQKTSNLLEQTKLTFASNDAENKVVELMSQIGEYVYSEHVGGAEFPEEIEQKLAAIDALKEEIAELKSKVAELKEKTICLVCGEYNDRENVFCAKCGSRLGDKPETEEETTALALHRETESESDGSEETAAEESAAASTEGMANGQ